nr:uncharacterized protein LOC132762159 [Anolis sagrei ordinatus]
MEFPIPAGSPREKEEKEGAGPGREALPQDWVALRYSTPFFSFFRAVSFLRSSLSFQTVSASSPPMPQAHVRQENETLNEENLQPNEQPQEDEFDIQKGFTIQVRVTGRTGGCEKDFLKEIADHLWKHEICLQTEDYREDSSHFLLIFCPVATSVGSDIANALEGLSSEPKAVLVLLHHKVRESTSFIDTKEQAQHPAVVRTVHARYLLDDGFYACQMNEEAVAQVAEALKDHWEDS